jgi:hypothetical protein
MQEDFEGFQRAPKNGGGGGGLHKGPSINTVKFSIPPEVHILLTPVIKCFLFPAIPASFKCIL